MVLFKVVASAYLTYYLKLLLYECAYVRAQVEVAMAGWTTEETRALLGLRCAADAQLMHTTELHIFDDRLMYHVYVRKIHLLCMRVINVSALSNYDVDIWIVLQR